MISVRSTSFALSANSLHSRTHALSRLPLAHTLYPSFRSPCQRAPSVSPLDPTLPPTPFTPCPLPLLLRCSIEFDQPSRSPGICPFSSYQFPGAPLPHLISPHRLFPTLGVGTEFSRTFRCSFALSLRWPNSSALLVPAGVERQILRATFIGYSTPHPSFNYSTRASASFYLKGYLRSLHQTVLTSLSLPLLEGLCR